MVCQKLSRRRWAGPGIAVVTCVMTRDEVGSEFLGANYPLESTGLPGEVVCGSSCVHCTRNGRITR